MPPTDPPGLGALARDLDRLTRRLDTIDEHVPPVLSRIPAIEESVTELGKTVDLVVERLRGSGRGAAAWLQVADPDIAAELLTDLVEWLDAVYLRYPDSSLPACWVWHPWVVEELLWLRRSHSEAYAARLSGVPVGEWHDKQRPGVVRRIRAGISTCDLAQHVCPGPQAAPPLATPLAGHMRAVAEAWTSTGLPPEPTSAQLADASTYEQTQLQRSSTP